MIKKREKTLKKKRVNVPVLLFVLILVFVVYSGLTNLFDRLLSSSQTEVAGSELASYPPNIIPFLIVLVVFIFVVIVFLNIRVKKKTSKRKRK